MSSQANILVIDDDETLRDWCEKILSQAGNRVATAEDGLKGLDILKKKSFDLIILDLKMPGLSGMEVLKKVNEEYPETSVVIITGQATVESAVEGMKMGAYDFIPKPFTPESFMKAIKQVLEKRRYQKKTTGEKEPEPNGEGFFW